MIVKLASCITNSLEASGGPIPHSHLIASKLHVRIRQYEDTFEYEEKEDCLAPQTRAK